VTREKVKGRKKKRKKKIQRKRFSQNKPQKNIDPTGIVLFLHYFRGI